MAIIQQTWITPNSSIYPSIHPLLAAAPDVFNESLYAERAAIAIMVMQPLRPAPAAGDDDDDDEEEMMTPLDPSSLARSAQCAHCVLWIWDH